MLPAAVGRPFERLTVTTCPSVTINVGPGTCIVGHVAVVIAAGANPKALHYSHIPTSKLHFHPVGSETPVVPSD